MTIIRPLCAVALAVLPAVAAAQSQDTLRPLTMPSLDVSVSRSTVPVARLPFSIATSQPAPSRLGGALAADAALRGIPGVQVANRFNDAIGERITMRGLGARAQFGIRGIHITVDGIPATMPDGQTTLTHLDAAAVTSAEVMRGAAGALWGNAAGGVIALRTAPLMTGLAEARINIGSFGLQRESGALVANAPFNGVAHARVTVQKYDGFRASAASRKTLIGAGAAWSGSAGRKWVALHAVDYDADNPGSLSQRQLDSARLQANPNNVRQKTGENGRHGEIGAGWQRDFGRSSFEVSAYALRRDLTNPIPPTIIDLDRSAGGARAVWSAVLSKAAVSAGVEAGLQSDDRVNHVNSLGVRAALTLDQAERVLYGAPFALVVLGLTPRIDATAAVRWDTYRFRARDHLVSATNADDSGTRSMDAPTYSAGLRAHAGAAGVYANVATSFQTPTTTELANRADGAGGFNPLLEPERTRSIEAGADYTHRGIRAGIALYQTRVRDALIPFEVPASPGRQYFRNAGSVSTRGAEVSARVTVIPALSLRAAYARVDAHFTDYITAASDFSGKDLPGVARSTFDGAAEWLIRSVASGSVSARRVGSTPVDDANSASSAAYTLIDADLELPIVRTGPLSFRVAGGVSNIADVAYNTAVSINAAGGRFFEPGPGRAAFVTLSISGGKRAGR